MPFLQLKSSGIQKVKETGVARSDRAVARLFGVDPATLSRVIRGQAEPSNRLIAGALSALGPSWFNDLFEVKEEGKSACSAPLAHVAQTRTAQTPGLPLGSAPSAGAPVRGLTSLRSVSR